ncbi:short chain dehydrogenase [Lentibacillus kapialis]|uniref:Short chain dehydrogenase n=1 Tax=Lentibacillus kapialis TaxID=340214 RepID=A0A917UVR9_9BACI|nr:short chain dehydrogenase [Lentibacillus kapialis]GGJ88282.1 short chain dehydrogenase [Lentibacillus kapialis]
MRILVVGASGTIGQKVVETLKPSHEVLRAGRNGADVKVDIMSPDSITAMYKSIGHIDAVINASGGANFKTVSDLTPELNEKGVESKLKGQINLVLLGREYLNNGGSFTLTTGVMMDDPIPMGSSAAMANGGVKAFVKAAAIEMPRGIRINCVSPNIVQESWEKLGHLFAGFTPVSAERVARAYVKSVEGSQNGQNYEVY